MLSRRNLLRACLSAASMTWRVPNASTAMLARGATVAAGPAMALLGGCRQPPAPPVGPRQSTHEGVGFIELFPHGADETAPLVVAIHGRGDRPENWVETWTAFPARAQIALPRAFDPLGDGFSWFPFREGLSEDQWAAGVASAEARLWKAIAHLAGSTKRRVVVTGFSQGGILSFAIAARHPDEVVGAFPVAGALPAPLRPKDHGRTAPTVAFHGTADRMIPFAWGRAAVDSFKDQGNVAELHEYAGVGHAMTAQMRSDLWTAIVKSLG
jgi:phospholipase/carboxylesterase